MILNIFYLKHRSMLGKGCIFGDHNATFMPTFMMSEVPPELVQGFLSGLGATLFNAAGVSMTGMKPHFKPPSMVWGGGELCLLCSLIDTSRVCHSLGQMQNPSIINLYFSNWLLLIWGGGMGWYIM